jgi:hypothetical protein
MELFPNEIYYIYSGVDVFTALSGGVGALYGPLHGGANEVNHIEHCSPLCSCIQNFLHVSAAIRN